MMRPGLILDDLEDLGVRCVGVGSALARTGGPPSFGIQSGRPTTLTGAMPGKELIDILAKFGRSNS
jgi:hypothetical protein